MFVFTYHWVCAKQFEQDPKPLYEAAKELINMQLESGLFPQQVTAFLKKKIGLPFMKKWFVQN